VSVDPDIELQNIEQELAELVPEAERRLQDEFLRFYEPHPKQLEFHQSQAAVRGLAGTVDMLWIIGKVHPYRPNYRGLVYARDCSPTFQVFRQVLLPMYKKMVPRYPCRLKGETFEGNPRQWPGLKGFDWDKAYDKVDKVLHFADGSYVEFKSWDQDTDAFAGPPRHIIREDEEARIESQHRENQARQLTLPVNMMLTFTPLNYSQWLYSEICEGAATSDNVSLTTMTVYDNPFINPETIKVLEASSFNEAEKAARLRGEFTYLTGRVWKTFGQHNWLDFRKLPDRFERILSIDPHRDKDDFANIFAYDNWAKTLYCIAELRVGGDIHRRIKAMRQFCQGEQIDAIIIDPSAKQGAESLNERTILDFYLDEFPSAILADNSRAAKDHGRAIIETMAAQKPDGSTRLYIMRNCTRTYHQFLNYSYKPPSRTGEDRNKPMIFKKDEDHCDCGIQTSQLLPMIDPDTQFKQFDVGLYANA
jgi:hypothetical protein